MNVGSPEFDSHQSIPKKFTCQGEDVNPALVIDDLPDKVQSLALIMDDPDAPGGTWVHWVVYDIPVLSKIEENSVPGTQGLNSWGRAAYGGPCPPSGEHRYFFKLYALDTKLNLRKGASKNELEGAMSGHVIDQCELVGLYRKS